MSNTTLTESDKLALLARAALAVIEDIERCRIRRDDFYRMRDGSEGYSIYFEHVASHLHLDPLNELRVLLGKAPLDREALESYPAEDAQRSDREEYERLQRERLEWFPSLPRVPGGEG